ncbi:DUF3180 domain-containing protein [Arthrobacter sp. M4]|uniref:DUF3180 domain-containing protein n=1 Tax=Arthrobacter sp. M4 TaxID=218160 RepID=UPI001CDC78BF|nr:DUF3180 domain-containing protein [Arthrobacter sp. M4]MCA4135225.1 DUF3180 domain-containing protein [Arthrobacter sp. M4]
MKPTRILVLAVVAVILAAGGWLATLLGTRYGAATPVLPPSGLVTMGVIAALTLILGLRILRWRTAKKKTLLNPLFAVTTLLLAQSCAYAGAVLLGWHAGVILDLLRVWNLRNDLDIFWLAVAMGSGGLVMVIVGLIVERFCRIPPEDTNAEGQGRSGPQRQSKGEGEYAYRGD